MLQLISTKMEVCSASRLPAPQEPVVLLMQHLCSVGVDSTSHPQKGRLVEQKLFKNLMLCLYSVKIETKSTVHKWDVGCSRYQEL